MIFKLKGLEEDITGQHSKLRGPQTAHCDTVSDLPRGALSPPALIKANETDRD